jgi:predicted ATPase/DNA-binding SARP family transcriptional activator
MEFRILGPLEVLDEDRAVILGGSKQRALLALFLVHANETLTTDRLIDELWGERPAETAAKTAKTVQMQVSRLRAALGADAGNGLIVTRQRGYQLRITAEQLDALRFERLGADGRTALAAGHPRSAVELLEEALSLWRDTPLTDLADEPFARNERGRLEDLRAEVLEQLIEAKLLLGRHAEVISQLEALIAEHPFRERLRAQLMLALYRCERQADALQAYQAARLAMVEELGIEPGERLRELERQILAQDPALAAPATPVPDDEARPSLGRGDLPTGVVTFMLTDIEGSSRLWDADPQAMFAALKLHNELVARLVNEHHGRLLKEKGEGDSTMSAFRRASDAATAAVALQQALAEAPWPPGFELRVRIALHTAEAYEYAGDYWGPELNRAARMRSLIEGGVTVLSEATAMLVREGLPGDMELVDLGSHQLRDLGRPENVFQLRPAGSPLAALPGAIPPPGGLPAPLTETLGRTADCEAVSTLLRQDPVRLVTLTGPGGVGKTQLALEVGRRLSADFPDGTWFVSLAATARPEHVASAIAQALGTTTQRSETPKAAIERFLAQKRALMVVDNFEHVVQAAALVNDLLAACPTLTVLVTSREALRIEGEQRYPVAPLQLPPEAPGPAEVEEAAAGALFVARARSHNRAFRLTLANAGAVADICRRLDGLPLAIELAAARMSLIDAEQLNTRLAQALDVLGSGPRDAPDRQRTLRATIDWSHHLLSASEAEAYARFAVFAGGATVDAAQDVMRAELDDLQGLVDKQLLLRRPGPNAESRLVMLETVHEYASERLEADPAAAQTHRQHALYYKGLAERVERELFTARQAAALDELDAEVSNFRAALDWSLEADPTSALALVGPLSRFWEIRGRYVEGLEWIEAALKSAGGEAPIEDRARAQRGKVRLLGAEGSGYDRKEARGMARAEANEALALSRRAGDPAGIAEALISLSVLDAAESGRVAKEAMRVACKADDDWLVGMAVSECVRALPPRQAATELARAGAALHKDVPELKDDAARLLASEGERACARGDMHTAEKLLTRAQSLLPDGEDKREVQLQLGLVIAERGLEGDAARAQAIFSDIETASDARPDTRIAAGVYGAYWGLAIGLHESTEEVRAAAQQAISTLTKIGNHARLSRAHSYMAFVDSTAGHWQEATDWLEKALDHARRAGDAEEETEVLWSLTGALQYGPIPVEEGIERLVTMLDPVGDQPPARQRLSARQRMLVEATGLAGLEALRGNATEARRQADRAKAVSRELGQLKLALTEQVTGWVALLADDLATAEADLAESLEIFRSMGELGYLSTTVALLAEVLCQQDRLDEAWELTEIAERAPEVDVATHVMLRITRGKLLARRGEIEEAHRLVCEAVDRAADTDDLNLRGDTKAALAAVLSAAGRSAEASAAGAEAVELYEQKGNLVSARKAGWAASIALAGRSP